MYFMYIFVV